MFRHSTHVVVIGELIILFIEMELNQTQLDRERRNHEDDVAQCAKVVSAHAKSYKGRDLTICCNFEKM